MTPVYITVDYSRGKLPTYTDINQLDTCESLGEKVFYLH